MSNSNNNKQPSINISGGQMYGAQTIGGGKQQNTFNLQKQRNMHQRDPEEKKEISYYDNIPSSSALSSAKIQNIELLQGMGFEINQCLLSLIDEYNDIGALLDAIEFNRSGGNATNPTTNLQPIAMLPPSSTTTAPCTTSTSTTTETVSTDGLNSSNSNPNSNNNNNMNTIMVNQYVVGTISNAPS
eukprot:342977_1